MQNEAPTPRRTSWFRNHEVLEVIEAILLSIATVVTAWSAYQAALWDGEQSKHYTQASAARADANRLSDSANTQLSVDISEYETWLTATLDGDPAEADLIRAQMRPALQSALDAWLAAGGIERTPGAPASPFTTDAYELDLRTESDERVTRAEALFDEGEEANRHSDRYIAVTVVFALVLFLVGIGSKFKTARVRFGLAVFGSFALLAGTVQMLALPIADLRI